MVGIQPLELKTPERTEFHRHVKSITKASLNPLNILQRVGIKGLIWSQHLYFYYLPLQHCGIKTTDAFQYLFCLLAPAPPISRQHQRLTCLILDHSAELHSCFYPRGPRNSVGKLKFFKKIRDFEDETFFNLTVQYYILHFMSIIIM